MSAPYQPPRAVADGAEPDPEVDEVLVEHAASVLWVGNALFVLGFLGIVGLACAYVSGWTRARVAQAIVPTNGDVFQQVAVALSALTLLPLVGQCVGGLLLAAGHPASLVPGRLACALAFLQLPAGPVVGYVGLRILAHRHTPRVLDAQRAEALRKPAEAHPAPEVARRRLWPPLLVQAAVSFAFLGYLVYTRR